MSGSLGRSAAVDTVGCVGACADAKTDGASDECTGEGETVCGPGAGLGEGAKKTGGAATGRSVTESVGM